MSSTSLGRKQSDSHSETRQSKRARDKTTSQAQQTSPASPTAMSGSNRKRKLDTAESVTAVDLDTDSSGGDGSSSTSLQSAQPKISRASTDGGGLGADSCDVGTMLRRLGGTADQDAASIIRFGLGDQQLQPVAHRYMVDISETSLLLPHRARSASALGHASDSRTSSSVPGLDIGVATGGGVSGGVATSSGGVVTGGTGRRKSLVFKFDCELGDMWLESAYDRGRRSHKKIVTGNAATEKVIDSLELQGYAVQNQLARGRFGLVLAAHSVMMQKTVALKVMEKELKPRTNSQTKTKASGSSICLSYDLPSEIQLHRGLKHRNVVELLDYHVINNRITMVMELCENGSLRHLLMTTPGCILSEPTCRRYFKDMFEAVAYLHSIGIVHRDIKCENFLIDRHNRVKLADFGSSRRHSIGDELCTTRHGTAGYWSPEVVAHMPYNPRTADVWALGVTLHILLTSKFPFSGDDRQVLVGMQKGLDLRKANSVRLSKEVSELLKGLLHYVLQVRFTINRVRCSEWLRLSEGDKPYIGNFYLVSKPRKFKDSPQERALKQSLGI